MEGHFGKERDRRRESDKGEISWAEVRLSWQSHRGGRCPSRRRREWPDQPKFTNYVNNDLRSPYGLELLTDGMKRFSSHNIPEIYIVILKI